KLADPGLLARLLLARGVVAAVLLEVPLFACGFDAPSDRGPSFTGEMIVFGLEPIETFLGKPCGGLGHGCLLQSRVVPRDGGRERQWMSTIARRWRSSKSRNHPDEVKIGR